MSRPTRVYLDNAATSWPKPEPVYAAVEHYLRQVGAAAGRGAYREALQVTEMVEASRRAVARLIGVRNPKSVVFTSSCTDALNLAIHGLMAAGGHVVTTVVEHNSVLRPLRKLEESGRVEVTRVRCDESGVVDPNDIETALRPHTRLVALVHASNVTGAVQPAAAVGAIVRDHKALFLLDAAQTLGELPFSVEKLGVDLLAAPGHKGLLGPLGTGVLYIRPGIEESLDTIRQGGTGSHSDEDRQPTTMPDKFEPGNLNVPGIVGVGAAAEFLRQHGVDTIREHCQAMTGRLLDGMGSISGVTVHGPAGAGERVGVVSISVNGYDPQELVAMLDAGYGVQVRAGLHCAPLMHRALETLTRGGTVRFSLGLFTSEAEVDTALNAVRQIAETSINA